MAKRKKPRDLNLLAASIVEESTRGTEQPVKEKNLAAVALGRLGGKKGGKARLRSSRLNNGRRLAGKRLEPDGM